MRKQRLLNERRQTHQSMRWECNQHFRLKKAHFLAGNEGYPFIKQLITMCLDARNWTLKLNWNGIPKSRWKVNDLQFPFYCLGVRCFCCYHQGWHLIPTHDWISKMWNCKVFVWKCTMVYMYVLCMYYNDNIMIITHSHIKYYETCYTTRNITT
jgi:hypothetical protein